MRSLYLMRHGKSDWGASHGTDHERPLKKRGVAAARRMGRFLTRNEQKPRHVLASSAVRAATTARLAGEAGGWDCPLEVEDSLYGASPADVLARLAAVPDDAERVLVVGHEPTLSSLVGELVGSAPPRFPTGALARVDFDASRWSDVAPRKGTLVFLVPPRLLDDAD